jgi:hypothetical protein
MPDEQPDDLRAMVANPLYRADGRIGAAFRATVASAFAARYPASIERGVSDTNPGGGTVHVDAYERRGRDGTVQTVQAHVRGAPQRAWEAAPNADFRQRIAVAEGSARRADFGYGEVGPVLPNGERALGRYQLLRSALADAGWRDLRTGNWIGPATSLGIRGDSDFLANPIAQEAAFGDVMQMYRRRLANNGSLAFAGRTIVGLRNPTLVLSEAALLAAVHRRGPGMVAEYLRHRDGRQPEPSGHRLRAFLEIETQLRTFADAQYRW